MQLTPTDLYKALAASPGGRPNTARVWRDVNPALPATPIQVYGPPATSGTRRPPCSTWPSRTSRTLFSACSIFSW